MLLDFLKVKNFKEAFLPLLEGFISTINKKCPCSELQYGLWKKQQNQAHSCLKNKKD